MDKKEIEKEVEKRYVFIGRIIIFYGFWLGLLTLLVCKALGL